MARTLRIPIRVTLGATVLVLAFAVTETRAQVYVGGGAPGFGPSYGAFGTTGIAGGYSSYGSRSFSSFGLGGFRRSYGFGYSSGYVAPGVGVYPVPAYGGYPVYGGGYPVYGGYPIGGFPVFTPPIGNVPGSPPSLPTGFDRVQGGTHIPGFGVVGRSVR